VRSLNEKVIELFGQHKYDAAIPLAQRFCDTVERIRGPADPEYAVGLNNLAVMHQFTGDFVTAEPLFKRALEIRRVAYGAEHPVYAESLASLGRMYQAKGELTAAEPFFTQALQIRRKALGQEHPDYLQNLNDLSQLHCAEGKYAQALPFAAEYYDAVKPMRGAGNLGPAVAAHNLAVIHAKLRDYVAAEAQFKEALEGYRSAVGPHHPYYVFGLTNLADFYRERCDYRAAEPLYKEAVQARKELLGDRGPTPEYADSLNNLGVLYQRWGDYGAARPFLEQAAQIRKVTLGERDPLYAQSLWNLGVLSQNRGDYPSAEQSFKEAVRIRKDVLGANHPDYAMSLVGLASLYLVEGNPTGSANMCNEALSIFRNAGGEHDPRYAATLGQLANIHYKKGEYSEAEAMYKDLLRIRRDTVGEHHREYAETLADLGNLYQCMAKYTAAETLLKESLRIRRDVLGATHPECGVCLAALALLYQMRGDGPAAESCYKEGIDIFRKAALKRDPSLATALDNLGVLYSDHGNYVAAEPLFQEAVELRKAELGERHPDYATSVEHLAWLCEERGESSKAEALYRSALQIRREILSPHSPALAKNLYRLARFLAVAGRTGEAVRCYGEAWAASKSVRDQILVFGSTAEQASLGDAMSIRTCQPFSLAMDRMVDDPAAARLAADVVTGNKGVILEVLACRQAAVHLGDERLRPLFEAWQDAGRQLAVLSSATPAPSQAADYQTRLRDLARKKEAAEQELGRASAKFDGQRVAARVGAADVAAALPAGSALVEYVRYSPFHFEAKGTEKELGDPRYAAVVVRGSEVAGTTRLAGPDVVLVPLGNAADIDAAIAAWRRAAYRPGPRLAIDQASAQLAAKVWNPVAAKLGDRRQVYLSPDGELAFVSFAALPGRRPETFLLEDYDLAYVATGRDLVRAGESGEADPLVVGCPDYGEAVAPTSVPATAPATTANEWPVLADVRAAVGGAFARLPGTAAEADAVAALLGQGGRPVPPVMGTQATEGRVRAARHPSVLHLATHGFFLPASGLEKMLSDDGSRGVGGLTSIDRPTAGPDPTAAAIARLLHDRDPMTRSGIVLAGANETLAGRRPAGGDDGLLTANEVAGMDLWGTKLVTLSACETGLGEASDGEGVYGLRRAFVLAGAQNLVMSLWSVDDQSTFRLITGMYKHIAAGDLPPRALLAAQREFIAAERKAGTGRSHPFYWAAFVSSGIGTGLGTQKTP
jgi:tetratricopeptide (TPR) repeat protein